MSKTLMLWPNIKEDIPAEISRNYFQYVDIRNLYKPINVFGRIIRKCLSRLNLSTEFFFDSWIENMNEYDKIIIHANVINRSVPRILRAKGYGNRIIYWYWNPVRASIHPSKVDRESCELWSFSEDDCKQYNMKYNSTYYFEKNESDYLECKENVDLFFVGADKGRYEKLMKIKKDAENNNLSVDFRIIKDNTSVLGGNYSQRLNYIEVVNLVKKSKAILELLQSGQTGYSLRVMESIAFEKKLITDNKVIVNAPFYNKNNIYVIKEDNFEGVVEFLNCPYEKIDDKYKIYYDYKSWLERFDEKD